MFGAPLLPLLPDTIIKYKNAIAVKAMDHGFENSWPGLECVNTGDSGQCLTQCRPTHFDKVFSRNIIPGLRVKCPVLFFFPFYHDFIHCHYCGLDKKSMG